MKKTESSRVWKTDWPNFFLSLKNSTVCSSHQHSHKNAWSVLHLRIWLLKTIQNTIKTWILLTFISLCNFVIVSSINFERTLIVASAGSPPPLLSQLFPSPVPVSQHLTTDTVRKRRGGRQTRGGVKLAEHIEHGGPPHRGAASFQGELWQLRVPEGLPKHAYFKRKPHTQNRENKILSGIKWRLTKLRPDPSPQGHHHPPGWRCLSQ